MPFITKARDPLEDLRALYELAKELLTINDPDALLELSSRILEGCARRLLLERRNNILERDLMSRYKFPGIITQDPGTLKVLETAAQIAKMLIRHKLI
jgi:hypothetical protein